MNGQALITIIVPVYKVENYLEQCVSSIRNQTYKHIEIILVDDGSPDKCSEMCEKYAKQDERIKVIYKENGGLSDARNAGLKICRGEYVTFVDSDDYIGKEYISYMYDILLENNADISVCEYEYITENGNRLNKIYDDGRVVVFNKHDALAGLCTNEYFPNAVTCKLFPSSYFRGVEFPKGCHFEDIPTSYKLFKQADKIVFGARALYSYLFRELSISKQSFSVRRLDAVNFTNQISEGIIKEFPDLEMVCKKKRFIENVYAFKSLSISTNYDSEIAKYIHLDIKKIRESIEIKTLSRKIKGYYIASYFGSYGLKCFANIETYLSRKRLNR